MLTSKEDLKNILRDATATVVFEKVDGSERRMRCTLMKEYLPEQLLAEHDGQREREENPNILAVWDIENGGWRSFRVASVHRVIVE
jgi:hypothetical protein